MQGFAVGPDLKEPTIEQLDLNPYVNELKRLHRRACPRQILGVRMGIHAGQLLGLDLPRSDKRLLALVETDGCFADGVSVATGCWLGRRTLRLIDYGKVAATVVDVQSGRGFRLWPDPDARVRAWRYATGAPSRWHAQLVGYQLMPAEQLLRAQQVELEVPVARIVGRPGRVMCADCGEEILNGRETPSPGGTRCRGCATDHRYYHEVT
jgi:formylmethanofuran dehydrogenase subunit E